MICLHHVQLAMPPGAERQARAFFADVLGLREIAKPPALAGRGGVWFARDGLQLHLGVQTDFVPATKAHPGILTDDLAGLAERLRAAGAVVQPDESLPGYDRFHTFDPFGNRIEFLQAAVPVGEGRQPGAEGGK